MAVGDKTRVDRFGEFLLFFYSKTPFAGEALPFFLEEEKRGLDLREFMSLCASL